MYILPDDDPTGIEACGSLNWFNTKIMHLLVNYFKLVILSLVLNVS